MILDGDTSDEEYIQDEAAAKADSDVCSDLDDDEAEKEEPEGDQSTNQEPDDHSDNDADIDTDDDNDDEHDRDDTKNVLSQSRKRTTAACRVLDSDSEDEYENEPPKNGQSDALCNAESAREHLCASSTVSDNTVYSAALFEDTRDCSEPVVANLSVQREELKSRLPKKGGPRRSSALGGDLEEASMPPLMLNDSMQSDESSESSFTADKSETGCETNANSSIPVDIDDNSEEARPPFSTQPIEEDEDIHIGREEQDNSSLELSLLWQPSMPPPAQVRKDSSEELLPSTKVSLCV